MAARIEKNINLSNPDLDQFVNEQWSLENIRDRKRKKMRVTAGELISGTTEL